MPASTGNGHKPRVCVVAPAAYNVLRPRPDLHHVGGAEVQVVAVARALRDLGYPVSFVVADSGQPDGEECDGVTVYKGADPRCGLPVLRFFHPRWTRLNAALKRADADVYLQSCADSLTGQVYLWAARRRRRFVFLVMNDQDCDPTLPKLTTRRERVLYTYGLGRADRIVAQTERQRRMLLDWRNLTSTVVLPIGGRGNDDAPLVQFPQGRPRILWLGRIFHVKRVEWLLELARACPDFDFDLVGGANRADAYAERILHQARQLPNVHLYGPVPHAEVGRFYAHAHALVLTSTVEGFPTVFIEAWSWGLPTVSTVDIDGLIGRFRLGAIANDPPTLERELRALFHDRQRWQECSRRARQFFLTHHTPAIAAHNLARVLDEVCNHNGRL